MKKSDFITLLLFIILAASVSLLFFFERNVQRVQDTFCLNGRETVVIDAGHGGEDGGAVGISGILEKDINLKISEKLRLVMLLFGVDATMTRSDDVALSDDDIARLRERKISDMKARVKLVNNTPSATLISIHQNSFSDSSCYGAQVFYSDNNANSKTLAEQIQHTLIVGANKGNKRIAKTADKNIFVLQKVNCPAVLVECGFITNEKEAELLRSDTYQTKISVCIAAGYMKNKSEK